MKLLEAGRENDAERCRLDHLKRYLKSLEGNISNFLPFVTGSDILTCTSIKVTFNALEDLIRRPVARTCGATLELPSTYQSYRKHAR